MAKLYKPTEEELKTILENHKHWLREDCEGWEDMKANMSYYDLVGASLDGASLYHASLVGASLDGASLYHANLNGASLYYANLKYAILNGASLKYAILNGASLNHASLDHASLDGASLVGASLDGAILNGASLNHASLVGASLDGASLYHANLNGASLYYANLDHASLNGASLKYAILNGASLNHASLDHARGISMACPSDGAFTAWKKAWHDAGRIAIIKLQIPEDAKRSSATGRKCRADKAIVLAIYDITGDEIDSAYSDRDHAFVYRKGETVAPDAFDDNRWNECSHGIHFFITRQEAEEYEL